jgi:hypothetical protein
MSSGELGGIQEAGRELRDQARAQNQQPRQCGEGEKRFQTEKWVLRLGERKAYNHEEDKILLGLQNVIGEASIKNEEAPGSSLNKTPVHDKMAEIVQTLSMIPEDLRQGSISSI